MNHFYCAGNWKMNKTPQQAAEFVTQLKELVKGDDRRSLVIIPSALTASEVASGVKGTGFRWGGQNSYFESKGAFTGENSPEILKGMGAEFCLVGHSERRHVFGEPDEMLAKKVQALQKLGMIPILCVGETIDDRRWNRTQEVIVRQLRSGLQSADPDQPLWLAYEPVWAIGTGQVATPSQVEEAHLILRHALKEWSAPVADDIPILYGGSVKPDNARALAALENVNGFLIGGASLDPAEFAKIFELSKEARA
jgi:triosephosphate isomerase